MFNLPPEERIRAWRTFRLGLKKFDKLECLDEVAKFWAQARLSNQYLSHDLPETWPTAWELVHSNDYDNVGVALGIFYTLYYSEIFDPESIMYNVYRTSNEIINTVEVDNHVLNYNINRVTAKEDIDILPTMQYNYKDIIDKGNQ